MKIKLTKEMEDCNEFFKDFPKPLNYVGGCVRDLVLGFTPHDYDMFTSATPIEIEAYIKSKGRRAYKIGARFGTVAVKLSFGMVEVTTYREETYDMISRKPRVTYTTDMMKDLNRRDFTINALYCTMEGHVKDRVNGLKDIKDRILRTVGNSKHRFKEDPLRILRGVRFATKYVLEADPLTARRMDHCKWELYRISKERIREEMEKGFETSASYYIDGLMYYNIFQVVYPALHLQKGYNQNSMYHNFTLDVHTNMVVDNVSTYEDNLEPKHIWAALLHDVAKPFVKTDHKSGEYCNYINHEKLGADMANDFCIKYKFSNKDREFIVESVANHLKDDCWLRVHDNAAKVGDLDEI